MAKARDIPGLHASMPFAEAAAATVAVRAEELFEHSAGVLDGAEEARLAFVGATAALPDPPSGLIGVADVGGGSSELVAGTVRGGVSWFVSVPVGSGVLTERHVRSDPPTAAELAALRAEADAAFAAVRAPRCECA